MAEHQETTGDLSGLLGAVLVQYAARALGPSGVKAVMDRVGEAEVLSLVEHWEEWVDFEVVLATAVAVAEVCHEPDIGRRTGEELFRVLEERGSLATAAALPVEQALPDVIASLNTATDLRHAMVMECQRGWARIVVTSTDQGRSRFLCRLLGGLYVMIPTLRQTTAAVVETACLNRGDRVCEFQLRWREESRLPGADPWADRLSRLQRWAVGLADSEVDHAPEALEAVRLLEEIRQQALRDPLTGLPNRAALELRVAEESNRRLGVLDGLTLLFVDLDGFKAINDDHGHAVGDELLRQVAARLAGAVRASDLVVRLGGDEFVVLYPEVADDDQVARLVAKVEAVFAEPFTLLDQRFQASGSVGVSRAPEHGSTLADLLARADGAMYRVKRRRRGDTGRTEGFRTDGFEIDDAPIARPWAPSVPDGAEDRPGDGGQAPPAGGSSRV